MLCLKNITGCCKSQSILIWKSGENGMVSLDHEWQHHGNTFSASSNSSLFQVLADKNLKPRDVITGVCRLELFFSCCINPDLHQQVLQELYEHYLRSALVYNWMHISCLWNQIYVDLDDSISAYRAKARTNLAWLDAELRCINVDLCKFTVDQQIFATADEQFGKGGVFSQS